MYFKLGKETLSGQELDVTIPTPIDDIARYWVEYHQVEERYPERSVTSLLNMSDHDVIHVESKIFCICHVGSIPDM